MFSDHEESALVPVHVCWNDVEADIVISFLGAQGIRAMSNARGPRSVYPVNTDGMGEIRVLVAREAAEEARALLAECDNMEVITEPSQPDDD